MSSGEDGVADATQAARELPLLDGALVLAQNLKLLTLAPLGVGLLALGFAFLITPTFTATARILPPQQQQSSAAALAAQFGSLAGLVGGAPGFRNPADQYVALLKSRTVFDAIIERFNLREVYGTKYIDQARRHLASATSISAGIKDGIISIEVEDDDPKRSADIANSFIQELRALTNTIAVTEAAQRRLFFDNQLKQARDQLTKSEIVLRASGVNEATLKTMPQSALEAIARLRAQITAQEIKLASMRAYMTDSNAELRVALQELSALRNELAKAEQSSNGKAAGEGAEYIAKYRDFKYHETLFELMAKQYELARLDEAREGAVIQVVDVAVPPERKSKPKKALIAIFATLTAFVLTLLFVLIRHALRVAADDPVSSEKLARLRRLLRIRRT
jgi:uncharacterized protein involved in exopolysaccharide biosynthesis